MPIIDVIVGKGSTRGEAFEDSLQVAAEGQTVFNAGFNIQRVFVDSILITTGYTGQGTDTITFAVGLNEGQEVCLTT